jgi:hypothetical protein
MKSMSSLSMALVLACASAFARAEEPAALKSLGFLRGEWDSVPTGKPGEGTGRTSFAGSLEGRVIVRKNIAEFPASAGRPASKHEDLMVIYVDADAKVKADFYDSEGHVIRYAVKSVADGQVEFLSEPSSTTPRYRLSYKLAEGGTMNGRFEIAPPGKPDDFKTYLEWSVRKTDGPRKK